MAPEPGLLFYPISDFHAKQTMQLAPSKEKDVSHSKDTNCSS